MVTYLLAEVLIIPAGEKVCIQSKQTDDITEMALFYRLSTGGTLTLTQSKKADAETLIILLKNQVPW